MNGIKALLESSKGNVFVLCSGLLWLWAEGKAIAPWIVAVCFAGLGVAYMVTRAWEEKRK